MMSRTILVAAMCLAACLALHTAPAFAQQQDQGPARTAPAKGTGTDGGHSFGQAGGHGGSESTSHAAGQDAHAKGELMPDPGKRETILSAVWVLVIFVALLAILYPTAWKNVLAGLKAREEKIRKDIAEAEASRVRAEATLREYNTQLAAAETRVREMLAKAAADGETIAAGIRTRAQQEAEETRTRALRDIDAARGQAVAELHEQAAVLATSVAEKILRRNLNADDQRDLVNRSLAEISTVGPGTGHAGRRVGGRA